ncbi:hypothetical protein [Streptomyces mirabilis]|uniref:hypothetical protein n=1 Tax=Streptomyces mirabilis TaxID=68239 RepID=UPI001160C727|nr:hypothetical protein [Streptomyces mirabilis]
MAVLVPVRILAQRLLESGRLRDEWRRFALAREGARHGVRVAQVATGQLPATTTAWARPGSDRTSSSSAAKDA